VDQDKKTTTKQLPGVPGSFASGIRILRRRLAQLPSYQQILLPVVTLVFATALSARLSGALHPPEPKLESVAGIADERDDFVPDETPIDKETYNWTGWGQHPKYISLPSIATEGFVEQVGLRENNEIDVPSNTNLMGWYTGSALPGEKGLSIIDGHLNGVEAPGVFRNLHLLNAGDQFTVETGDGSKLRYEVMEVRSETASDALNYLFSQEPSVTSQLNLITCGGVFNDELRRYDERVIVSAKLL